MSESKKGIKGGNCNRTACQKPGAVWFNSSTRAYYCTKCAAAINEFSLKVDGYALCLLGGEDFPGKEFLQYRGSSVFSAPGKGDT